MEHATDSLTVLPVSSPAAPPRRAAAPRRRPVRPRSGHRPASGAHMMSVSVGSVVAGHRIEEVVARGGMGVVYRVTHVALERERALKLIAPELAADESFKTRFRREWKVAASIDHPHAIPIRRRRGGRTALHRHALRPGHGPATDESRRPAHRRRRRDDRQPGCRRSRCRAQPRPDPPGHQAGQHPRRVARRRAARVSHRLRPDQAHGLDGPADGPGVLGSGPWTTSRPSRSRARRSTPGPTSTDSVASHTTCLRARSLSHETATSRRFGRTSASRRRCSPSTPGHPGGARGRCHAGDGKEAGGAVPVGRRSRSRDAGGDSGRDIHRAGAKRRPRRSSTRWGGDAGGHPPGPRAHLGAPGTRVHASRVGERDALAPIAVAVVAVALRDDGGGGDAVRARQPLVAYQSEVGQICDEVNKVNKASVRRARASGNACVTRRTSKPCATPSSTRRSTQSGSRAISARARRG